MNKRHVFQVAIVFVILVTIWVQLAIAGSPMISVTSVALSESYLEVGDNVIIIATVENTGNVDGSLKVIFRVDNVTVYEETVTVGAGSSTAVTYTTDAQETEGSFEVDVNGETATFTVGSTVSILSDVAVFSSPSGANIYLDGFYKGTTESKEWVYISGVSPGYHTIKVSKSGYEDYEKQVYVSATTKYISATLTKKASISISSSPSGASIYLNGSYKGTTPKTVSDLPSGYHTVKISKSGYEDYTRSVYVSENTMAYVSETLTPIPTATATPRATAKLAATSTPIFAKIFSATPSPTVPATHMPSPLLTLIILALLLALGVVFVSTKRGWEKTTTSKDEPPFTPPKTAPKPSEPKTKSDVPMEDKVRNLVRALLARDNNVYVDDVKELIGKAEKEPNPKDKTELLTEAKSLIKEKAKLIKRREKLITEFDDINDSIKAMSIKLAKGEVSDKNYEKAAEELDIRKIEIQDELGEIDYKLYKEEYEKPVF